MNRNDRRPSQYDGNQGFDGKLIPGGNLDPGIGVMKSVKASAMESSMNADEPLSPNRHVCHLVIAATFTAEPLEQPLAFWTTELNLPVSVEFAPYNQVFQQLLDPGSQFSRNQDGVNVVQSIATVHDGAGEEGVLALSLQQERRVRRAGRL
jgi:hypothetical protein